MTLKCPFCGNTRIIVRQIVSFVVEYEYNTDDTVFRQHENEWDFTTDTIYCEKCKETFHDIEQLEKANETNVDFKRFLEAFHERFKEEITYRPLPTDEDLKSVYKEYLASDLTLQEFLDTEVEAYA